MSPLDPTSLLRELGLTRDLVLEIRQRIEVDLPPPRATVIVPGQRDDKGRLVQDGVVGTGARMYRRMRTDATP